MRTILLGGNGRHGVLARGGGRVAFRRKERDKFLKYSQVGEEEKRREGESEKVFMREFILEEGGGLKGP